VAALVRTSRGVSYAGLARAVASGIGIGHVPLVAGTLGSLAAVLIGAGLMRASARALPAAALAASVGGLWAVRASAACDDPGWVVIDEFAGQWIAMLALRKASPRTLLAAFILFRLIDIAKPWPVSLADRSKTAVGVMGDDVLAGGIAAGVLCALQVFWPGVFAGARPLGKGAGMIDGAILNEAERLLDECRRRGLKLATAESCTGGLIAATLTAIAGSSDVVERGFVTYSNAAKTEMLDVPAKLIAELGAVSEAVAARMAEGALAHSAADVAVSVTGIAGPGGGSAAKPVGLVWFGLGMPGRPTRTERHQFAGDRAEVRRRSVAVALHLLQQGVENLRSLSDH
jgi:nicotinamide-nucleotide amidase